MFQTFSINPPNDIELGLPRETLKYRFYPAKDDQKDAPLVLIMLPWGAWDQDEYYTDKLVPWLAEQGYASILSNVHSTLSKRIVGGNNVAAPAGWFEAVERAYGVKLSRNLDDAIRTLRDKSITNITPNLPLLLGNGIDYMSFGLLGALDWISIIGDVSTQSMPFDRERVIAFGTSYGGYMALLMQKFMPNGISLVVDNSGFVNAQKDNMNEYQSGIRVEFQVDGVSLSGVTQSPWDIRDPNTAFGYKEAHEIIRDLSFSEHFDFSETAIISYMSSKDELVNYQKKKRALHALEGKRNVQFVDVTEAMVDGHLFKHARHGFGASLRALFLDSLERIGQLPRVARNDFARETRIEIQTQNVNYCAQYHKNGTVYFSCT